MSMSAGLVKTLHNPSTTREMSKQFSAAKRIGALRVCETQQWQRVTPAVVAYF